MDAPTSKAPHAPATTSADVRRGATRIVAGLCLAAGAFLVVALFWQALDVYVTFLGDTRVATSAQGDRYEVTALACGALLLTGTVAAVAARRRVLTGLGVTLLVVGVVVAFVFPVPSDRWEQTPAPREDSGVTGCHSGSDSDQCRRLGG